MNETFSAQSSKQATPPNQSLISQDSWIVRHSPETLAREYRRAQGKLNSAGPGTSREEWSELKSATEKTLAALQEGDKDGWEARVFGNFTPKVSCAPGNEPISGRCYEAELETDLAKSDASVKPQASEQ